MTRTTTNGVIAMVSDKIREIAANFQIAGNLKDAIPIVQGHINDT